jgi:hypothetical protein
MNDFQHGAPTGTLIIDRTNEANTTTLIPYTAPDHVTRRRAKIARVASQNVEAAVYSYIQAMRALGKTKISAADIATALSVPIKAVERAGSNLGPKGVKRA